jgi:spore coat protein U-like protein
MRREIAALGLIFFMCDASADTECNLSSVPMSFGNYDDLYYDLDSNNGSLTVSCTVVSNPTPSGGAVGYSIKMGTGNASNYAPRQMRNGTHLMNYNLYMAPNRNVASIWGDGSGSTQVVSGTVTGLNSVGITRSGIDHIVYGRIPKGQSGLGVGSYGDTIVVTLTF